MIDHMDQIHSVPSPDMVAAPGLYLFLPEARTMPGVSALWSSAWGGSDGASRVDEPVVDELALVGLKPL
jgi:hypothetical protein